MVDAVMAPTPPAPSGLVEVAKVLRDHHEWHLGQGVDDGSLAGVDLADAYADGPLCSRTVDVLRTLDATLSGQRGGAVPAGDSEAMARAIFQIPPDELVSRPNLLAAERAWVRARFADQPAPAGTCAFSLGDRVEKIKGSSWRGRVVGTYSTSLTPRGYAVESEREPGSVQIYPEAALRAVLDADSSEEGR